MSSLLRAGRKEKVSKNYKIINGEETGIHELDCRDWEVVEFASSTVADGKGSRETHNALVNRLNNIYNLIIECSKVARML